MANRDIRITPAGILFFLLFLGSVVAANWALENYGLIPVGFGLVAPAGVIFAGLTFTLRDLLQEASGRWAVLLAILGGGLVSALLSTDDGTKVAIASVIAFIASEAVDGAVYQPLRAGNWYAAVGVSNLAGLLIDSVLFAWLAFASFDAVPGLVVGKIWVTLASIIVLAVVRRGRTSTPTF